MNHLELPSFRTAATTILITFFLGLGFWHSQEGRPSSMDETRHMRLSLAYRDMLFRHQPLDNPWSHVYPPLYHLSMIPALSLGIPSEAKAAATHGLFLIIFLIGCGLIGHALKRPDFEGIVAVMTTMSYALILWATRRAMIDFPLLAWVTLSFGLLLRTDRFSRRNASLLWGLSAGVGMLIKAPFLFFIIGPIAWALFTGSDRLRWKHAAWGCALAVFVALPWYFWEWAYFLDKASGLLRENTGEGTNPATLAGWLYYFRITWTQLGPLNCLWTLGGLILAFAGRRIQPEQWPLLAWAGPALIILTLIVNKDPRHSLPLLPAITLLSAQGWGRIARSTTQRAILLATGAALLLFSLLYYDRPARENWQIEPIGDFMVKHHNPRNPLLTSSVLSHHPRFFSRTFLWTLNAKGIPLHPASSGKADATFAEFIIRRVGDQVTEAVLLDKDWNDLLPESEGFKRIFKPALQVSLPDESQAIVYERQAVRWNGPTLTRHVVEQQIERALRVWVRGPLKVSIQASSESLQWGTFDEIRLVGGPGFIKKIPIHAFDVRITKPWINLDWLMRNGRVGLLSLESLSPSITLSAEEASTELQRVRGLTEPAVEFTNQGFTATARFRGIPVRIVGGLSVENNFLIARLESLRVGGVPLPGWLLGKAHIQALPLYPTANFPATIHVTRIHGDGKSLTLSPE